MKQLQRAFLLLFSLPACTCPTFQVQHSLFLPTPMSLKLEHHGGGGGGRKKKVFGIIPRATLLLLLFYTSSRSLFRGGGGGGGGSCRSVSASRIEQREGSINITPSSSFPRFSSFFPLSPPAPLLTNGPEMKSGREMGGGGKGEKGDRCTKGERREVKGSFLKVQKEEGEERICQEWSDQEQNIFLAHPPPPPD